MRLRNWVVPVVLIALAAGGCDTPRSSAAAGALPTVPTTIEGAADARVLLCDTDIQTASLADDGRVVVAHSVGLLGVDRPGQLLETTLRETHQLVRVEDGQLIATRYRDPGTGPHWSDGFNETSVVSFATGTTVDLPDGASRVTIAPVDGESFWAVFRDTNERWQFGHHAAGTTWQQHPAPGEPQMPVARNGMLWAQSDDCALLRMSPTGETKCVDARRPGISKWVTPLGPSLLLYGVAGDAAALDTSSQREVALGCPGATLHSWVDAPFAAIMQCDDRSHRLWSEATGAVTVDPSYPPERWPAWESTRFLSVGPDRYFDATNRQFVQSASSLLWVAPDGHDYGRKVDYPCPGMGGEGHDYGQWQIATCISETTPSEARDLRARSRTISSCTSPASPPTRITAEWLIDNKADKLHKITGMKVIGLSEHGIVGIQGSGHDLDEQDGVRIVLQPYPPSAANAPPTRPEIIPIDGPLAATKPTAYEQAYYEYLCIYERLGGEPDQLQAYEGVFERYGLSEGHSTPFTTKLHPSATLKIRQRVNDCTTEEARRFGSP